MANYWLPAMAAAFAAALGAWIWLVFRAGGRKQTPPPRESSPHREVIGGKFRARAGGRQVMPDPGEPIVTGQAQEREPQDPA